MDTQIILRLNTELKDKVRQAAQEEDRSVSSWVRHVIKKALEQQECSKLREDPHGCV